MSETKEAINEDRKTQLSRWKTWRWNRFETELPLHLTSLPTAAFAPINPSGLGSQLGGSAFIKETFS